MERRKTALPAVGMRIIKSALGVLLVFLIYLLRGRRGTPFYSALSVLWCMQPHATEIKSKSFQRTVGTFIGALFGLFMILLDYYVFRGGYEYLKYLLISFLIIPVIYTTIVINKKDASYFSCVVFLSIAVNHLKDANPYIFVINRVVDTLIGIALAYCINTFRLPRKKQNHILFISELDEVLLDDEAAMTPYSRFELNRMLDHGAKFTIATMRPPAALIPVLKDIRIKLPVIAMDGAILYDIQKNHIIRKFVMQFEEVDAFLKLFNERGYHCFVNVVIEDTVVIYYDTFKNEVEKALYKKLRHSPYRNYMKAPIVKKGDPIYLMLVDQAQRISDLYEILRKEGYTESFKIIQYDSKQYPGYAYIKIYNKEAKKKNMLMYLQEMEHIDEVVTLGSKDPIGDQAIYGEDANAIVKNFKKAYEPYFWQS